MSNLERTNVYCKISMSVVIPQATTKQCEFCFEEEEKKNKTKSTKTKCGLYACR